MAIDEINFREARVADLDILIKYMEEFHDFDHTEPFDRTPARSAMETVVANEKIGRVWLIQKAKVVVGYIVLTLGYRLEYRGYYAFLDELYVRVDERGQGIGTKAIRFLEEACQQIGVSVIQLEVKQDNPGASALYERVGFDQQARHILTKEIPTARR
ncbi:MAG: GNAT family N-acetyltransferase [Saprospiraceae bacterium]